MEEVRIDRGGRVGVSRMLGRGLAGKERRKISY